ncbi:polysaccharide biosynthesis tyrosine autokinase [Ferrimonas senticii]|uniref:polysaccharide biosynthesis tyrosine autokinase n=1 Tax=Ferrimonas senticii TaxID=394566 RepID=UPI0004038E3A|nr:polysaccharide biosynthesis tyrosine autokinase [Ferrimonas senticii]
MSNIKTTTHNDDEIDLSRLFGHLLEGSKLIVAITAAFAAVGVAIAVISTPIYQADALVQVESKSSGVPGLGEMSEMFATESESVTEIEIIKSRMVLGDVVHALDLTTAVTPQYLPIIGNYLARRNQHNQPSQWQGYALGGEQINVAELQVPRNLLGQALTLETTTSGYQLRLEDEVLLQGKIGESVNQNGISIRISEINAALGTRFTVSKLDEITVIESLKRDLAISERGKQSGILALTLQGQDKQHLVEVLDKVSHYYLLQNIKRMSAEAENSLQFVEQNLPEMKAKLERAETALNDFQSTVRSVDMSLETEAVLKSVVEYERRLNELNIKETEIQQLYTQSHPVYQALLQQRQDLQQQKDGLTSQIEQLPETQQQLLRLRRDVEVAQTIYLQLLNHAQELAIVKASTVGNVRIIDAAVAQVQPIKPKKALIAVLATLLGFMASIALVLVRAMLKRGVETPEQIEELGLSVYASVPKSEFQGSLETRQKRLSTKTKLDGGHALLAHVNPADLSVEALRSLRTSLHFAMLESQNNILMLSGPAPNIGKSFISANLGTVMANSGSKVLVIDADMRKGYMQRMFGCSWDDGLSDFLAGKVSREQTIRSTLVDNMDFVPRGQVPPNPAELLMLPKFREFMQWASSNYDLVIIDTPPILAVTDAAIVGAIAGTSIMVVKHRETPLKEIEFAVQRFATSGVQIKGVILNQLVKQAGGYGNYGYYQYDYSSK